MRVMQRLSVSLFLLPLLAMAAASPAVAAMKQVQAEATYTAGDNDSPADARDMCMLQAKRALADQAGVYLESYSRVHDFQLTEDDIETYSAAMIRNVTVTKDDKTWVEDHLVVTIALTGDVDPEAMEGHIATMRNKPRMSEELKDQNRKLKDMEASIARLNERLEDQQKAIDAHEAHGAAETELQQLKRQKQDTTRKRSCLLDASMVEWTEMQCSAMCDLAGSLDPSLMADLAHDLGLGEGGAALAAMLGPDQCRELCTQQVRLLLR